MSAAVATAEGTNRHRTHQLSEDDLKILRRLLGGTVGGVLQAATSHPFDTVKSRVQNGIFPGMRECVQSTWRAEGIHGFYRGVSLPLVLCGVYNSILFSLNQFMVNYMTPADHNPKEALPLWRIAAAAQLTAPLYVLCITPTEKIKVQLQVQRNDAAAQAVSGPISCARRIIRQEGYRGLFSGYVPTVASRLIGLPFYFMGNQVARQALGQTRLADSATGREVLMPMLGGVASGICFWTSNYPCDFVKTQLQAAQTKTSIAEVVQRTYKAGGVKAFYKGYAACLLRSAPANASVWLGIDMTTRYMINHGW